jgi:flagellar biosynthesis/type III secretory pathway protein FliH
MSKKRKCRFDDNEIAVHDMAVKLRKKTDEQLVDAFQKIYDQGYQNGLDHNKLPENALFVSEKSKKSFLDLVKVTPGIGNAIYKKIENLVIQENGGGQ